MNRIHHYQVQLDRAGNQGSGTSSYTAYSRDHDISAEGKIPLPVSSDPSFSGSMHRYNPEELLFVSLSSRHILWYLQLCAKSDVVVTENADQATVVMQERRRYRRLIY